MWLYCKSRVSLKASHSYLLPCQIQSDSIAYKNKCFKSNLKNYVFLKISRKLFMRVLYIMCVCVCVVYLRYIFDLIDLKFLFYI